MNAQTRALLIQELNNLKIELDRANKFKNQHSDLSFTVNQEHDGCIKLFATLLNMKLSRVGLELKF